MRQLWQSDRWMGGLLLAAGLVTRMWMLTTSHEVVFDEVHFGKFVTAYCCTGENFFDIHPPHGKLLIAAAAKLGGYAGGLSFDHIGQEYPSDFPLLALRIVPALAGGVLPVLVFVLMRHLNVSSLGSLAGGAAVLLDNALITQTRFVLIDGILLSSILGSLIAFFVAERQRGWGRAWLFFLAGALAGLAAGTKFTGLVALALLGVLVFVRILKDRRMSNIFEWLVRGFLILISAVAVYAAGWVAHFAVLPNSGSGDVWYAPSGNIPVDTIVLHQKMLSSNYYLAADHPDASQWWSWPAMNTSVFYWSGEGSATVYLLGNPVVWWGGLALFVLSVAFIAWCLSVRAAPFCIRKNQWVPYGGYIIAFAPLVLVPRALFLYHYLTPLVFSLIAGIAWADRRGWITSRTLTLGGALAVLGFLFFSPLTYGFEVPAWWNSALFWLPSWR